MANQFSTPSLRRSLLSLSIMWVTIAGALCAFGAYSEPGSSRTALLAFGVLSIPPVAYWLFLGWLYTRPQPNPGEARGREDIGAPRD